MLEIVRKKLPEPIKKILRKPYRLVNNVFKPMPSNYLNFEYNKKLWDGYAKGWNKKKVHVENDTIKDEEKENYLNYLGDEWGRVTDLERIISEYIYPYITKESVVGEIGVGGARIASKVVYSVKEFYAFDISSEMLKKARSVLGSGPNVHYVQLRDSKFSNSLKDKFDFIYSFDVFVHLDLHTIKKYFYEISVILQKGGKAFIHTSNLKAPGGWKKFSSQDSYSIEGHYFISPEIIDIISEHSNLKIIKKSSINPNNFYLNRDYLFILEK